MTAETISPQTAHNYFVPSPVSEIKFGKMRFLITDRPTDMSLDSFIKELERHNTKAIVRVCDSTYNDEIVKSHGIDVKDWEFNDGSPPPKEVIDNWLKLVYSLFNATSERDATIAVHCVAGLGRSPLLVAIALLEAGMPWSDAVYYIRSQRRGALNERQLEFLREYKPTGQLRKLRRLTYEDSDKHRKSCAIM